MRPELRDKLLEVADRKSQALGATSFDQLADKACVVFEKLALSFSPIRTREGLIAALDSIEFSESSEKYAIPIAEHFGHVLREVIEHLVESGLKELPPAPVGRKHALNSIESAEVCRRVAELYAKLPDLEQCKARVAQRFGISPSTVSRAWRKRGSGSNNDIQIAELIKYVKTELFPKLFVPEGAAQAAIEECKAMIADGQSRPRG